MAYLQPAPIRRVGLRGLAKQLSRLSSPSSFSTSTSASPFVCRQCLKAPVQNRSTSPSLLASLARSGTIRQLQVPASSSVRYLNTTTSKSSSAPAASIEYAAEPAAESKDKSKSKSSSFPDTSSKSVAYWLLGSAASVFGIVVFGGLTRLTESGYAHCSSTIIQFRKTTMLTPLLQSEHN